MKLIDSRIFIGQKLTVVVDRPLGTRHPRHEIIYELNYGYLPGTIADDGKELDAYIIGVDVPVMTFCGRCIAVIERINDSDDKLIIVPDGYDVDDSTIRRLTFFQEQFFESRIIRDKNTEA